MYVIHYVFSYRYIFSNIRRILIPFLLILSISQHAIAVKGKTDLTQAVADLDLDDGVQPLKPLEGIDPVIQDGYFYRTFDKGDTFQGVYTKSVTYYTHELFKDTVFMRDEVFKKDTSVYKNYFGVVFFGIWSFPEEGKEYIELVEVPVRKVVNDKMEAKKSHPRLIWRTQCGSPIQEDVLGRKYEVVPCNGFGNKHTEDSFLNFIKDPKNQQALWQYFLEKSKGITNEQRKLDVLGFKCYSTNDACDECHENLVQLQHNHTTMLPHLPPEGIPTVTGNRNLPFLILFDSNTFYKPGNISYQKELSDIFGSSLHFYPKNIRPLLRLMKGIQGGEYECIGRAKGSKNDDEIQHQDTIRFEELQQLNFICIRVNSGEKVKVSLQ
jgi:hypothetical protein